MYGMQFPYVCSTVFVLAQCSTQTRIHDDPEIGNERCWGLVLACRHFFLSTFEFSPSKMKNLLFFCQPGVAQLLSMPNKLVYEWLEGPLFLCVTVVGSCPTHRGFPERRSMRAWWISGRKNEPDVCPVSVEGTQFHGPVLLYVPWQTNANQSWDSCTEQVGPYPSVSLPLTSGVFQNVCRSYGSMAYVASCWFSLTVAVLFVNFVRASK